MKTERRWIKTVLADSTDPGIILPWARRAHLLSAAA